MNHTELMEIHLISDTIEQRIKYHMEKLQLDPGQVHFGWDRLNSIKELRYCQCLIREMHMNHCEQIEKDRMGKFDDKEKKN